MGLVVAVRNGAGLTGDDALARAMIDFSMPVSKLPQLHQHLTAKENVVPAKEMFCEVSVCNTIAGLCSITLALLLSTLSLYPTAQEHHACATRPTSRLDMKRGK